MKFKNKVSSMILLLLLIIVNYSIAYSISKIEYKIFIILYTTCASIMYIFAIFEYYQVSEKGLTHVKKLGFQKKEVFWKDINEIFVQPNKYFKAVVIQYGMFNANYIVINAGVKDYKKLVKIVLDRTKDNPKTVVDSKIDELLK